MFEHTQELFNFHLTGFHQYCLTPPVHLCFASENLCRLVGFSKQDLQTETEDAYAHLVHPEDRAMYQTFLRDLSMQEQSQTAEYRLIRSDGSIIWVSDTTTSKQQQDGTWIGYSVLTDISRLKQENETLQLLNDAIPCGFITYTCEKQPKLTFMNKQMQNFLRMPEARDGEFDYLEAYRENLYFMLPMEERRRFARFLRHVDTQKTPISGELTVLRCDGTRAHLFGWVAKRMNKQGVPEFQSACMDMTEQYHAKQKQEQDRYLQALTDVYDKIFEYDRSSNTVKCLHSQDSSLFKRFENIPMQMEEATEKWIADTVIEPDQEPVRAFFTAFFEKKLENTQSRPPQIAYSALSSSGTIKHYRGIFLQTEVSVSLYCCRHIPEFNEADTLRQENLSLKKSMQELVMRFTDGIAAFEVCNQLVTPLYASDNICKFFGFSKEEWMQMMQKSTPLKEFVAHSSVSYEQFMNLWQTGEAEFPYYDFKTESERRIKAICTQKYPGSSSPRYVMLYHVDEARSVTQPHENEPLVSIRTFGYFDVFVGGKPIAFRNKKSKELLALLVDRRSGFVTSEEAISFLWEDAPADSVTLARYRKVALRLKNTLEEYGIPDIIESVDGKRRLVTEKVRCDLYDYLSGREEFTKLFKGSYLTNYSWGETTLAELTGTMLSE